MKTRTLDLLDFTKVDSLLEGFNKSTGFVTAILDLEGNVLSTSGWRQICTEFHRVNPETSKRCTLSDTMLSGKMEAGEKYHFYQCLNGLIDVAVPIIIRGEHIANLFSGQFFFEEPDRSFFQKQADTFGFNQEQYLKALRKVPVVSKEKVMVAMDFLLNMTQMISEMAFQKLEQMELNDALSESEKYNRMLFEQSVIGLALTSLNGTLIDINSTFAKIIGRTVGEAKKLTYWDITPEKYKDQEQKQLDLLTKTGRYGPYEKEYIHKEGHLVPVRLQGLIIERNNEKFIWSIVEDISEKKKVEQDVMAANERLSQTLERISDGFGSLDRNWNYTFVNEKLAQNVGKKREELVGRNIWNVFPEAIGTPVYKAYLSAMKEQVVIDLVHYYPPFERWFQHRFYPSPDGISVFSKDITESKLAEEKIRENSSLIRIAAEKAKLGGWNVDLKENRSYWSDEVAAIHEMPPGYAPLVDEGINFYAPEWRERIIKVFTDCATKGIPYDEEMEIITSTGKRVWIRTIGEAVKDENGKIFKVEGAFQDISERKSAEAKSREKDQQFRKLSANVPDLIFQFTRKPDGTYCVPVASEGIRNIFGCTPEEVVNDFTPIGRVIYPDDAERVIDDIEYSAKHLTYFTCEFRVKIPGRPIQWIFSRSTPERLPDGSITWYGFNADITQRKEFEDALRESEGKFRKIYEEGPFGMALVTNTFTFITANRTFCDITGYTESELRKLTFRDITFPDDKETGVGSIQRLIKGEIPVVKLEKRYVRKEGQIIWGAITVAANFDKNGKFLYNLAIIEDITGRKQAEEKIQTLNERLALLVEAIQELSISTSMDSIMATVRTSARKLVNADGTTFILREGDTCYYADEDTVSPLWKGQRFAISHCISGWAMLNKQPVVIEDIYRDSRVPIESYKSTFVKSLAIAPIRLNDPLGAIGAYWGQTFTPSEVEIKLLNTLADAAAKAVENIQLIEGLEVKVSERTSQLKAANQELEAFSYSVSHDLRAPLRHINGYVDLLNSRYQESLPEQARHYLASVTDAARRMGVLIDDLLYFSRTSRQELSKKKFSMNALVDEVLEKMKPDMQGRKIHLSVQKLPEVVGDHALLKQVWANLLENAVKYTKLKELAKISVECKEEKENYVFSVSDNGVGFDMQYSQKLFGVFQRLHAQTEFEGTGIGLANVKRIIHKHNGKVWAEAEVDKGATFYFSLPKE